MDPGEAPWRAAPPSPPPTTATRSARTGSSSSSRVARFVRTSSSSSCSGRGQAVGGAPAVSSARIARTKRRGRRRAVRRARPRPPTGWMPSIQRHTVHGHGKPSPGSPSASGTGVGTAAPARCAAATRTPARAGPPPSGCAAPAPRGRRRGGTWRCRCPLDGDRLDGKRRPLGELRGDEPRDERGIRLAPRRRACAPSHHASARAARQERRKSCRTCRRGRGAAHARSAEFLHSPGTTRPERTPRERPSSARQKNAGSSPPETSSAVPRSPAEWMHRPPDGVEADARRTTPKHPHHRTEGATP